MAEATKSQPQVAAPSGDMPGKLASAAAVANPFQSSIAEIISSRRSQHRTIPKLIGILARPSPPSIAYAQFTKKACEQVGIDFEIWQTWAQQQGDESKMQIDESENKTPTAQDTDLEADVEDLIIAANADDTIHGIMVSGHSGPCK